MSGLTGTYFPCVHVAERDISLFCPFLSHRRQQKHQHGHEAYEDSYTDQPGPYRFYKVFPFARSTHKNILGNLDVITMTILSFFYYKMGTVFMGN